MLMPRMVTKNLNYTTSKLIFIRVGQPVWFNFIKTNKTRFEPLSKIFSHLFLCWTWNGNLKFWNASERPTLEVPPIWLIAGKTINLLKSFTQVSLPAQYFKSQCLCSGIPLISIEHFGYFSVRIFEFDVLPPALLPNNTYPPTHPPTFPWRLQWVFAT